MVDPEGEEEIFPLKTLKNWKNYIFYQIFGLMGKKKTILKIIEFSPHWCPGSIPHSWGTCDKTNFLHNLATKMQKTRLWLLFAKSFTKISDISLFLKFIRVYLVQKIICLWLLLHPSYELGHFTKTLLQP